MIFLNSCGARCCRTLALASVRPRVSADSALSAEQKALNLAAPVCHGSELCGMRHARRSEMRNFRTRGTEEPKRRVAQLNAANRTRGPLLEAPALVANGPLLVDD